MIPSNNTLLTTDLNVVKQPSKQHKMNMDRNRILGICDGLEAVRQSVFKILNTERYAYIIYSWNYGIELNDLYGQPVRYVCPEIERRIQEALLQDDRITAVDEFEFDTSKKGVVSVSFTVHTFFGDLNEEMVVNI
jgi:phage baseplate assembly protein W